MHLGNIESSVQGLGSMDLQVWHPVVNVALSCSKPTIEPSLKRQKTYEAL